MSENYVLYSTAGTTATITLNRPDYLNAIVRPMWTQLDNFIAEANRDPEVKVIVLRGAGRAFCAGFDFGADGDIAAVRSEGRTWDPGRDAIGVTNRWDAPVPNFMGLWSSPKPTIAQVHGWCVGGGSDMALSADLVVAAEDAQIGTPYSRMWGCYLTAMWVYRLGLAKAKEYALTGKPLSGAEAARVELINQAVPTDQLDEAVEELAEQLSSIPSSQLAAMKLVVNQAYEGDGAARNSQVLGSILDGAMRKHPRKRSRSLRRPMTEALCPAAVCPTRRPLQRLQPAQGLTGSGS